MKLPELQHINLPTGRLAYRVSGDGPPLLLLHGWGGSSRYWLGAFATLADSHTIYALDMPGFGDSPPGWGSGGLRGLTAAALYFIDALGLEVIKLGGHSLGAAVALMVAATRPSLVNQLALVSFGLPRSAHEDVYYSGMSVQLSLTVAFWTPWLLAWRPWLALSRPWRELIWTIPPLPALLAAPMLHRLPDATALVLGASDLMAMDALSAFESASSQGDPLVMQSLRGATMPTLVLAGHQDPIFPPASATILASALPRASLALIDECGHVPMAEQPEACYQHLGGFFAGAT